MANSSALPFPIPSGAKDVVPLDGNKGLRGMEHHVSKGGGSFGARDVVPLREGIRACGR